MVMNYSFREFYYDWLNPFMMALIMTFICMTAYIVILNENSPKNINDINIVHTIIANIQQKNQNKKRIDMIYSFVAQQIVNNRWKIVIRK